MRKVGESVNVKKNEYNLMSTIEITFFIFIFLKKKKEKI